MQNIDLGEKFAMRRRRQAAAIVTTVAAFVAYSLLPLLPLGEGRRAAEGAVGLLVLLVVVGMPLFTIRNWRCPGCGTFLGLHFGARSCEKCGLEFSRHERGTA